MAGAAGSNSQVNLSITLTNTDLLNALLPVTITRTVPAITYQPSNAVYFDVIQVSTNTPLVFLAFYTFLYVRNLGITNNITLTTTFGTGGVAVPIFLPPGSVFIYGPGQPTTGGGTPAGNGIVGMTATSSTPTANSPIELYGAF